MSDMTRRHALETFLERRPSSASDRPAVEVRLHPERDFINLRGRPDDREFRGIVEDILGQPLPLTPNTWTGSACIVYWLGPDEWLLATTAGGSVLDRLTDGLAGRTAAVNGQNGGLLQLSVSGEAVRELLAKGCTLDLHPSVFKVGQCAQTGLAKASVLIGLMNDTPSLNIIVRRSFAEYLALWLDHAGREFALDFVAD